MRARGTGEPCGSLADVAAIDLLLTENLSCERLHQTALSVLLRETPLLERLTGVQLQRPHVDWEPDKGRFDLSVHGAGHHRVLIELKVDAALHEGQIEGQLAHAEQKPDQPVVYLLLGTTGITRGSRWPEWKRLVGKRPTPTILRSAPVRETLRRLQGDILPADVLDLARAYEQMLAKIDRRTQSYEGKILADFEYLDFFGFFDALCEAANLGGEHGVRVEYVSNPGGGFVSCAWGGRETSVAGMYLQFEETRLCVKISVDDDPELRRSSRAASLAAALAQAERFAGLGVQRTRGRLGETMTVVELSKVELVPNPRDLGLLAKLKEAEAFLHATADVLRKASPST